MKYVKHQGWNRGRSRIFSEEGGGGLKSINQQVHIKQQYEQAIATRSQTSLETSQRVGCNHVNPPPGNRRGGRGLLHPVKKVGSLRCCDIKI